MSRTTSSIVISSFPENQASDKVIINPRRSYFCFVDAWPVISGIRRFWDFFSPDRIFPLISSCGDVFDEFQDTAGGPGARRFEPFDAIYLPGSGHRTGVP